MLLRESRDIAQEDRLHFQLEKGDMHLHIAMSAATVGTARFPVCACRLLHSVKVTESNAADVKRNLNEVRSISNGSYQ